MGGVSVERGSDSREGRGRGGVEWSLSPLPGMSWSQRVMGVSGGLGEGVAPFCGGVVVCCVVVVY